MERKFQQTVLLLVIVFSIVFNGFAKPSKYHTFHTSLTRIDYNPDQKLYEISIQLFTHDLIPLLEKKTGQNVNLEKPSAIDKTIFDYLNENFILKDKKGNAKNLKWIGKESDADMIWVYVESPSIEGLEGYSLQNTLFFESFPEQTNLVICRYEGNKADLLFKAGDQTKEIITNKSSENEK